MYALPAKRSQYLPIMLSKNEVKLGGIQGLHQLMVRLLSGCDLPMMEYMHLLVKHIYFKQCEIVVR